MSEKAEPETFLTISVTVRLKDRETLREMMGEAGWEDVEDDEIIPHALQVMGTNFSRSLVSWMANPRAYGDLVEQTASTRTVVVQKN